MRLLFLLLLSASSFPLAAETVLAGYLPEYRVKNWKADNARGLTDLLYFGLEPAADGAWPQSPVPAESLAKLKAAREAHGCRLLICIGGWGRSRHFPALAASADASARFVSDALGFCQTHGFQGLDLDWEHPKDAAELKQYAALLFALRRAFDPAGLRITVALAPWQDLGAEGYAAVHAVHLMSYDHAFPQATLDAAKDDIARVIKAGCPPEKLVLGVPFYGRSKSGEARTYAELAALVGFDPTSDQCDGFAFNGPSTMLAKAALAREKELGGLMIWELGQDSADGALRKALNPAP